MSIETNLVKYTHAALFGAGAGAAGKALQLGRVDEKAMQRFLLLSLSICACFMAITPDMALAATATPWESVATSIFDSLTGPMSKIVATLGIVVLGFMAMAGKLEWDTAIKVVIGVVLIYGASKIVTLFGGLAAT